MDINKALLISLLLLPAIVSAHSGGKDKYGCHHDRKNGGYHCHKGDSAYHGQTTQIPNNSINTNFDKPQALKTQTTSPEIKESKTDAYINLVFRIQSALNQLVYVAEQPVAEI